MIPYITYTDLIIKIREALIIQSELNGNRVINATSVRGPALRKLLSDDESASLNLHDGLIIFELIENADSDNNTILQDDNSADNISEYKLLLKIYGNNCHDISQKLVARFKIKDVIMELYENGVWVKNISFPVTINEFLNDTVWPRCDIEMTIIARYNINTISMTPDAEEAGRIIINRR